MPESKRLTPARAAAHLKISLPTLYSIASRRDDFPEPKYTGRTPTWTPAQLDAWRAKHPARKKKRRLPDPDVHRANSSVSILKAHLIITTKYRRKVLSDDMLNLCERTMRETAERIGVTIDAFNGEADHVHLLVQYPPTLSVSSMVRMLKGASSRAIRSEFVGPINRARMHGHVWTSSYFISSAGGAPLDVLKEYIRRQDRPNAHPEDGDSSPD